MTPEDFNLTTELNTHGLPVGVFEASLSELATFLGLTDEDYDRGDQFDFEFEMIATDGTVFNSSNVGANVPRPVHFHFITLHSSGVRQIDDPSRIVLEKAELVNSAIAD